MKFSEQPVPLAAAALVLALAACGNEKAADAPTVPEAPAPAMSVKAGDASVESSDIGTVVRAGDVSVSIYNSK